MKITVITDQHGKVAGTIQGVLGDFRAGGIQAGLLVPEGGQFHEIEVPDDFAKYYAYPEQSEGGVISSENNTAFDNHPAPAFAMPARCAPVL